MASYDFTLKFTLPDPTGDPACDTDALFDAGCDDALVGIGENGTIALNFNREAPTAADAVSSAIAAVKKAIPRATLVEIEGPSSGL